MKRFLLKTTLAIALVLAVMAALIAILPRNDNAFLAAYNVKADRLAGTPSPRIIFVSGSSLLFGLDSEQIERSLGLPVVNYSLHAGIGLKFMIDDVAEQIQPGDIVVVAPEYSQFFGTAYGEVPTLAPLISYAGYDKLRLLDRRQWRTFIKGIPQIVSYRFRSYVSAALPRTYKCSGVNKWGDETAHWALPAQPIVPEGDAPMQIDETFAAYFLQKMDTIERQAIVVVTPPPIRYSGFRVREQQALALYSYLKEHGRPFNVLPPNHVLPDSCAYDASYHLTKEGVDRFTQIIIDELSGVVGSATEHAQ